MICFQERGATWRYGVRHDQRQSSANKHGATAATTTPAAAQYSTGRDHHADRPGPAAGAHPVFQVAAQIPGTGCRHQRLLHHDRQRLEGNWHQVSKALIC